MPVYCPGTPEVIETVDRVMREIHPRLAAAELRVDVLEARPRTDDSGEPCEEALKHNGYPCLATIKIRGPKDRGEGRGDVLLTIDAYRWPELEPSEQTALIDHELTHIELKVNDAGAVTRDDYNRPKLRIRLHDHQFGWFDDVAARHPLSSQEVQQARAFADNFGQIYLAGFHPLSAPAPQRRKRKAKAK